MSKFSSVSDGVKGENMIGKGLEASEKASGTEKEDSPSSPSIPKPMKKMMDLFNS